MVAINFLSYMPKQLPPSFILRWFYASSSWRQKCRISMVAMVFLYVGVYVDWPIYQQGVLARISIQNIQEKVRQMENKIHYVEAKPIESLQESVHVLAQLAHRQGLEFETEETQTAAEMKVKVSGSYPQLAHFQKNALEQTSGISEWFSQTLTPSPDFLKLQLVIQLHPLLHHVPLLPTHRLSPVVARNPFNPVESVFSESAVLRHYPVQAFKMVGTWENTQQRWALMQAPDHQIMIVRVGDSLGEEGKIVRAIQADQLVFDSELVH